MAMRKIQRGQRLDLWPRVYSRFVRALVPAMIIASSALTADGPATTLGGSEEELHLAHTLSAAGRGMSTTTTAMSSKKVVAFRPVGGGGGAGEESCSVTGSVYGGSEGRVSEQSDAVIEM